MKIWFNISSRYALDRKFLRGGILKFLKKRRVAEEAVLSVRVGGDRLLRQLKKKYWNEDETTDVLSFSQLEGEVGEKKADGGLYLGDVVVSFPQARKQARQYGRTVDQVVLELILHGVKHLLGEHHR